ncbi:MAG: carbohydrate-binding family 9-like protein [Clostridia bacterium]|nr:carbohydrate-binding family 9-like protein [Clostridia bacterium]
MYTIKEKGCSDIPVITLTDYINTNGYYPKVEFNVCYSSEGFHVHFTAYEKNPKAIATKHFGMVHLDSCLEWFVVFDPEHCDRYFNFEVNPNGAMNVSFRKDRYEKIDLTEEDLLMLGIKTEIFDNYWTADYTVTFDFIKKYIPDYEFKSGMTLPANVYKCGDETEFPHWGCWCMVDREKPDFHKPEYFGTMVIE